MVIRKADMNDFEDIYRLCCEVELRNNPVDMNKNGFLMTNYSSLKNKFMRIYSERIKDFFIFF